MSSIEELQKAVLMELVKYAPYLFGLFMLLVGAILVDLRSIVLQSTKNRQALSEKRLELQIATLDVQIENAETLKKLKSNQEKRMSMEQAQAEQSGDISPDKKQEEEVN